MRGFKFQKESLPSGVDYFNDHGLLLRGSGAWRDAICPFHKDIKPSLRVRADSGAYRCMVCGAHGGDILSFHINRSGLSFVQAAKELGAWIENS